MENEDNGPPRSGARSRTAAPGLKPSNPVAATDAASAGQTGPVKVKRGRGRPRKGEGQQQLSAKATQKGTTDNGSKPMELWEFETYRAHLCTVSAELDALQKEHHASQKAHLDEQDKAVVKLMSDFEAAAESEAREKKERRRELELLENMSENIKTLQKDMDQLKERRDCTKSQKEQHGKDKEMHEAETPAANDTPHTSEKTITQPSLQQPSQEPGGNLEEVDLLTPENSPRREDAPETKTDLSSELQPKAPQSNLKQATPTGNAATATTGHQSSSVIQNGNKEREAAAAGSPGMTYFGVALCPEACFNPQPNAATKSKKTTARRTPTGRDPRSTAGSTTATPKNLNAFVTPPKGKKRPEREPEDDFVYSESTSLVLSNSKRCIADNISIPSLSEKELKDFLSNKSVQRAIPNMDYLGFRRTCVSKTEILYEHTRRQDRFVLLCPSFGSRSPAEVEYTPLTVADLMKELPDFLKGGSITFKKDMMDKFVQYFVEAIYSLHEAPEKKKPALQKSI